MRRWQSLMVVVFLIAVMAVAPLEALAENYGQLRALQRRAATVQRQKNEFVARVLQSYAIPHLRNDEGIVLRLQIGNQWRDVNQIEIVPILGQGADGLTVVAHEIFFYTAGEILHLVSALTIR